MFYWIIAISIGICGIAFTWYIAKNLARNEKPVWIVGLGITVLLSGFIIWYAANSNSGKRSMKDQISDLNGVERIITVYDINGNVLATYQGKMDVETKNENYILFDDEEGKRHIIYITTGTVIIDEIE